MQRHRLHVLAALLLTLACGQASAQRGQREPSAQPVQVQVMQQPQPQGAQQAAQAPQAPQGQQPPQQPFVVFPPPPRVNSDLPVVELAPLLQRVERASNKRFLVDGTVGPRIYLGGVEENDIDYPVLLSVLRANGLAAVEIEGRVNIVRESEVRFLPAPVVQADDPSIAADEWVTRVIATTNIGAAQLVPILRPLLPQSAHLAAHGDTNRLIVMDRYQNVKRITEIVRALDVPGARE